ESPRYLLATGQHADAHAAAGHVLGEGLSAAHDNNAAKKTSFFEGFVVLTRRRDLAVRLIGASAAWFLMDFAYYGNTVSSPLVLHALGGNHTILQKTLTQLGIFTVFAAPGYAVAALTMDKLGSKNIQSLGFAVMGATFGLLAVIPNVEKLIWPFLIIYGLSYFFTEF